MWSALSIFILRNRFVIMVLFLLATGFMSWQATGVKISYDLSTTVPEGNPLREEFEEFKATFGEDGNVLAIGVRTPVVFRLDFYQAWYDLGQTIKKIEGIDGVLSVSHAFNIVKDADRREFLTEPLPASRPTTQAEVDSLRDQLLALPFYRGLVYDEPTGTSLMAVSFSPGLLDSRKRLDAVDRIVDLTTAFGKRYEVELHHSGLPYIRTNTVNTISREIRLFMTVAVSILALLLFLLFRNLYAVIFPTLVVGFSAIWSLALLHLFGYKVTTLTGLLPTLIVVTGIPNCIYLINKYHLEFKKHSNKQKALMRTVAKTGNVLWYVNVTTAIGFGVCYFTNVKVLSEFGMVSFVSCLVLFLISITIIPVGFSFLPEPKYRHTLHLEGKFLKRVIKLFEHLSGKRPWTVFAGAAVVAGVSIVGITMIRSKGFVLDDMSRHSKVYTDLKFFEKHFNGVLPFEILINTGRNRGAYDLTFLRQVDRAQDSLAELGYLSRPLSLVEAVKFGMQAYRNGNPQRYRLPNSFELTTDPFLRSYIANSDLAEGISRGFVDDSARIARISLQIEDLGSDSLPRALAKIKPMLDQIFNAERRAEGKRPLEITITGTSVMATEGFNYLVSGLVGSVIIAFLIIAGMMAFLFRSLRMLLISLVPNVIPLLVTAGIMGFLNIPLKPSTVIIFGITFGITVDSTIHFLAKYRQELYRHNWDVRTTVIESLHETGISMIYTSLILFFGFIVFAWSSFEATVNLGRLTVVTLVMGTLCNLLLLPALLIVFDTSSSRKVIAIDLEPVMDDFIEENGANSDSLSPQHEEQRTEV
jgi:predicted RND superfamily exporter protein